MEKLKSTATDILDLDRDRQQVSSCRLELLQCLQTLETQLTELAACLRQAGLPAFSGFEGSAAAGRDYTYLGRALQQIQYENEQEANRSVVFPGLAAVDEAGAALIEQVNHSKRTLKALLLQLDRIRLYADGRAGRLSDFLLRKTGYSRLHRLQAYRLLSFEEIPIQVATFFWQKVKRSRTLTVDTIIERLESMPPSAQVSADLEKMYACPQDTRFSLITTDGYSPAVNLLPVRNRLTPGDRQALLRRHPRLVLNARGNPFSDMTAATAKARILTDEIGEPYEVVDLGQGGYGLFPSALLSGLEAQADDNGAIRWYQRAATMPVFYRDEGGKPPYLNTMAPSPEARNKAPRQPRRNARLESEPFLQSLAVYRHRPAD